ncbi:GAD-like domain-containing protein [Rhizobium aegyptiacum]|uniref:GAD-like domain-containing protein n=1 Tax=Rhizobium aegyptiacum TaxID=1764550 RepID=UPI0007E55D52|nr:GAD-like domain-containing protein [Rhizobium aegyptiacum]
MSELFITYQNALMNFGEPQGGSPLPAAILDGYRGRIPDSFLDFMSLHSAGKWLQGYFQFCNPEEYQSVLALVLGGDEDLKPERTHVLGFSAFGDVIAWNEDYKTVEINILYGRVSCPELFSPEPDMDPKITLGIVIGNVNAESYDNPDEQGKPMFKRLLSAHGELEVGQIYAPKLHPALGGPITIDNLRPAGALAAMTIAAQAAPFTLYNTTIPAVPAVRDVGA